MIYRSIGRRVFDLNILYIHTQQYVRRCFGCVYVSQSVFEYTSTVQYIYSKDMTFHIYMLWKGYVQECCTLVCVYNCEYDIDESSLLGIEPLVPISKGIIGTDTEKYLSSLSKLARRIWRVCLNWSVYIQDTRKYDRESTRLSIVLAMETDFFCSNYVCTCNTVCAYFSLYFIFFAGRIFFSLCWREFCLVKRRGAYFPFFNGVCLRGGLG